MQELLYKIPAKSVYLLENLHFLPFFVADSVPGCIIISKGDNSMLDDILSLLGWIGGKILDFKIHGFRCGLLLFTLLPLIIFIIRAIVYS